MLAHPGLWTEPESLIWMHNIITNLINKVERTGEFIAGLQEELSRAEELSGAEALDLGEDGDDSHCHHFEPGRALPRRPDGHI